MKLDEELGLRKGLKSRAHESILNIFFTGQMISKRAREFFSEYGITEVQFNLLGLLYHQPEGGAGLTQAEIGRMMLVHRSNITGLIDRMEKNDLVRRADVEGDRRYNAIHLTKKGRRIFAEVESKYMAKVSSIMDILEHSEIDTLIGTLERVRNRLRQDDRM